MKKVYISSRSFGRFCPEVLEMLKGIADVEIHTGGPLRREELMKAVSEVDGVILGDHSFDGEMIEKAKNLKIIARHGVGLDKIDLKVATKRGILVTYTPGANSESVADFAFGLIISLARKIPQAHFSTRSGNWEPRNFMGLEVYGKTIGIIGLGAIGKRMVKRARGFEMKVFAFDPFVCKEEAESLGVSLVGLEELLRDSDFVSIHCPLLPETKSLIGKREFQLMKKSAFLINTARAQIVDEYALYEALKECRIKGAAIDVYEKEPPESSHFFELSNCLVTPHIAAYTEEAMRRMDMMNVCDLIKFFRGERPENIANPEVFESKSL